MKERSFPTWGSSNGGVHTGHLWTASGSLLGSLTFSGETATGWQAAGTTVVACNTGNGPTEGCSEVPVPNMGVQAYRDNCTNAGSVVSDRWPTAGADAKCTPAPGAFGPLTPNVIYHYELVDAEDIEDARENCTAMPGTFEVL